ncbi:MAG TPA: hypothetical protein PK878_05060 [bacterium]|nr:hypothetical protein [bacterium]
MNQEATMAQMAQRLDQLYEFDREPVGEDRLHKGRRFAAVFAGEHVAGTEFVIGAMFVLHGVTATDLLVGLLIGNLLAVLSWTLICAPIATQVRLTLYWYVRKIAGPGVMVIYNLANAFLYCILAGAMITVAATAVGIPFNIPMPKLNDMYPNSVGWVVVVVAIGLVVGTVAILGFKRVSQFSAVCVPWMFLVFIAGAIAVLPQLGEIRSFADFMAIAHTKIWNGVPAEGQEKLGMMHIIFFAWFCNLACTWACPTWPCSVTRNIGPTASIRPWGCTWAIFSPGFAQELWSRRTARPSNRGQWHTTPWASWALWPWSWPVGRPPIPRFTGRVWRSKSSRPTGRAGWPRSLPF